ncbi:MAG TPA: hypothetical protein VM142_05800 [Acidimicrobiales bacterium]|nr:hypothetical protein [Acidimicrobiales bacterium]
MAASIPGSHGSMEPYLGLVDTGAESVLAASWLADLAGLDLSSNSDKAVVGIGGQVVEVVFAEVELRLHRVDAAADFISWRTDVGFVRTGSRRLRWSSGNPDSSISSRSPSTGVPARSLSRTGLRSMLGSGQGRRNPEGRRHRRWCRCSSYPLRPSSWLSLPTGSPRLSASMPTSLATARLARISKCSS